MINIDGATLLFRPRSVYFNPFMVDAAKEIPQGSKFRHPTSLWSADKHPSMPAAISAISIRATM